MAKRLLWMVLIGAFAIAAHAKLPACNSQVLTRRGDTVSIPLPALARLLNHGLHAAHYQFRNLQLTSPAPGHLKVILHRQGKTFSLTGPLKTTPQGVLRLHATHITENGSGVKGLMGLFGQDLADYLKLQRSHAMRVRQNDLFIYPDRLLHLRGKVKALDLSGQHLRLHYASQPCR